MLSCGADGKHVYFGVWEDLSDRFPIDLMRGYVGFTETWEARPLSRIERVDVATKKHEILFEEKYWISHINLSPTDPNRMTYCHEGPWNRVDHRIWGLDISSGKTWKIRPCS
ncbi:MAG: oligogalacturonide lyase, partial [Planctomycetia bacterium]|nr:oligogalacturonide lyase [Planctomycetia bacterium]